MDCSRRNGLNHPFRVHLTFSQTQLVELVMWQVQYIRNKGLGLAYCSHNASKKLLTACQHWKHNITCLSDWAIYRWHSQLRQSCCPNLSCDQFSQSCSAGGKVAPGVYILPHKAMQECRSMFCLIKQLLTCEIIFFVYVAWRKKCTVMSSSCSSKMFGWRQNSSRGVDFASWGKIDTAWVIQKIGFGIGYRQWNMKNIGIGPKKKLTGQALFLSLSWCPGTCHSLLDCCMSFIKTYFSELTPNIHTVVID